MKKEHLSLNGLSRDGVGAIGFDARRGAAAPLLTLAQRGAFLAAFGLPWVALTRLMQTMWLARCEQSLREVHEASRATSRQEQRTLDAAGPCWWEPFHDIRDEAEPEQDEQLYMVDYIPDL